MRAALAAGRAEAAAQETIAGLSASNYAEAELQEAGQVVVQIYRDLHAQSVHGYHDHLSQQIPEPALSALFGAVQPDIDATLEWNRRLEEMAGERLANDIVDKIKARDADGAEAAAVSLILSSDAPEHRAQRARQVGNVLGKLVHEKDRAQALIRSIGRNPSKFGLDPISATDAEEEFARSGVAAARRDSQVAGSGRAQLTEAVVELGRTLPGRNALHEPTPEDLERFDRAMRSIFRSCLLSPDLDKYHEATMLIVEFSPKEVSAAGTLAGIEQRLFATLGRTGRAVATKVLSQIGANPHAFKSFLQFTRQNLHAKIGRYTVEALGLLANAQAVPLILDALNDKRSGARMEAIFALGSIADPQSISALLQALSQDLRSKLTEGEARRDAFLLISALGRATRAMTNVTERGQIIAQVIKLLPRDDLEFPVRAVLNFFTGKQEGVDPALQKWAAQVGTAALWSIDRPELARAGRAQPLGFRQPLIDLLARLAPHVLPVINQSILEHSKAYSGAYLAVGELYTRHPDPSEVPVIKQLILNTALHDDSRRSEYVKETVLDTATDQRSELTKDRVVASLAYALDKIATPEAQAALAEMFDQIQAGRLPRAGQETADILMRAHMRAQKEQGVATMAPGTTADQTTAGGPVQVTEQDMAWLADLDAKYVLPGKRRAKKVAAMAALAQRKVSAAVRPFIAHLVDTDAMIASAAMTALQDFGTGPLPQTVQDHYYRELIGALETSDNSVKVKVAEVLQKLGPSRAVIKERLEKLNTRPALNMATKAIISKLLGVGPPTSGGAPKAAVTVDPEKLGAAARFMPNAGSAAKGEAVITDLDKKRAYLQARQEWIRSGKRGPEPVPPQ